MGKKTSTNAKCQRYLSERRRIKNKTADMKDRLDSIKIQTGEEVMKHCRIGRAKEGFVKEDFKFKPRKVKKSE